MTDKRQQLRTMVRGAYDLQKLRIATGNRVVGNFKAKLGQEAGEKEETLEAEAKRILDELRKSYKRITDGLLRLPTARSFKGDEVISEYTEFCLVRQYIALLADEMRQFKDVGDMLFHFPVYTGFLEGVKGVGPAMAGVIISQVDIHKARYASSLHKFAGLDVVAYFERYDDKGGKDIPDHIQTRHPERDGLPYTFRPNVVQEFDDLDGLIETFSLRNEAGDVLGFYRKIITNQGRSRRKEHLVKRPYIAKDGTEKLRDSITFDPLLKTKLMGVLAGSFLRCDSPYRDIYDGYKHHLENRPDWAERSKGHRHQAALRYMIKAFLIDLYTNWRAIEGLPVAPSYAEAKLGLQHGKAA